MENAVVLTRPKLQYMLCLGTGLALHMILSANIVAVN